MRVYVRAQGALGLSLAARHREVSTTSMIGRILASGQLGKLASFVSPAFFDVMPSKALWAQAKALFGQSRDQEAFRRAVAARRPTLAARLPQIELVTARDPARPATPVDADWRGGRVVELYFQQLFEGETTLLDLRASAFTPSAGQLVWHPAPWMAQWAPEFIGPLREIYRGFYAGEDAIFRRGLAALHLEHSADLFRKHFGGDQASVTFRTADFVGTFHEVFMRCKKAGTSLHANFLPLGIYLAALYDHLEQLAVPVNVGLAFRRATDASSTRSNEMVHD
jgi:hypothetical protein